MVKARNIGRTGRIDTKPVKILREGDTGREREKEERYRYNKI